MRLLRLLVFMGLVALMGSGAAVPLMAQQDPATTGTVKGEVTTQSRAITLGGVQVIVFSGSNRVANVLSEGDGSFVVPGLAPGEYRVTALLEGFQPINSVATLQAGQTVTLEFDLELAETVIVRGDSATAVIPSAGTLAASAVVKTEEMEDLARGTGIQGALKLLTSVIEVPGGIAIKGGRPNQASLQLGPGIFVDPATGLSVNSLPDDAIDSITVLPNPYAVEFGRFSSGLILVQTRRGADKWRLRVNNLDPSFRTERGTLFQILGIQSFYPRLQVGGPIIKDKVFLQQSFQYRYRANDVASRPQDELRVSQRFASFTRVDANLSERHSLVAAGGVFPGKSQYANLGTFTPPNATVDMRNHTDTIGVTERAVLTSHLFLETTGEVNRYNVRVEPQGSEAMNMVPATTFGNFFNTQSRNTSTYQFVQTLTGTSQSKAGLHQYKGGVDLVHSRFTGMSQSNSVLVRRTNGDLVRQLDYQPATEQDINSTDFALFAQDRWQPNGRWYIEFGARLDRDGVAETFNLTPRAGSALLLNESGSSVIRGGFGLFYERTPSAAGAFEQYESPTETRFGDDGVPLGPSQVFRHVKEDLDTSRSATWDVGFDHRFNKNWSIHIGAVERRGSHELIIDRITAPAQELRLNSGGESRYREVESSAHFTGGPGVDLNISYVRSQARADLNAFSVFYDNIMAPVFGENGYGPARADAPNRLLVKGRAMPFSTWLFTGILDWRTGLPYSIVDAELDFVGPRNSERFPTYIRLDLGVEHQIKIGKFRPWVGIRADNAFNYFLPQDVQANISSPAFGGLYNTEYRQFKIQFRIER